MEISVGTDIIEIDRIKTSIERKGDKFLQSIYTENEIKYCEERRMQKYQSYAARFAAKEAIYKALSTYTENNYNWKDLEIINLPNGKPEVRLNFEVPNLESIDISISHCKEYAVAYVTAIFKEK